MEPVLIATDAQHRDACAVSSFTLDMAVGHDKQDFTACFERMDGVGGGSFLYIDGTEYGGVVDDVTTDTESGIAEYHGRTWGGVLAAKIILPPDGADYRVVSGEANSVLASLVTLLDVSDVFRASTEASGITVPSFQFDRFTDAYTGIQRMLRTAGARLKMERVNGRTVLSAVEARVIQDEADSDLVDFNLTATNRTVNHLVCLGTGELQERVVIHLYADAEGNVSQTQTLFGVDEVAAVYDYSNAEADELLEEGTKKLKEYQTQGSVDITGVGSGDWDIGDTLVARDNRSGTAVSAPIVGKTVKVDSSTNWQLRVEYKVGEASRTKVSPGSAESSKAVGVTGVKGNAESAYRSGNVNLTPADIGAVSGVKGDAETSYRSGDVNITYPNLGTAPIANGGTGATTRKNGIFNLLWLGTNPTGGTANDTRAWWAERSPCIAFFSATGQLNGQPSQYGFVISVSNGGSEVHQEWWTQIGTHYRRGANYATGAMPGWTNVDGSSCVPKRTQLYNNATGTTGTVTLSATAANYNHLRIHYRVALGVNDYGSVDVYSPNGKTVDISIANLSSSSGSGSVTHLFKNVTISGTSITRLFEKHYTLMFGTNAWAYSANSNYVYVVRVEGWNE